MMINNKRYTSGRIAMANLSASIDGLMCLRGNKASFANLSNLSNLLFLRGDLLGRITDHDLGEVIAQEAIAQSANASTACYIRARLAGRFHRFEEAECYLGGALEGGYPEHENELERAGLLQATGKYERALLLRERLAKSDPGIHSIGALATLLAEMGEWTAAETCYSNALEADNGISPIPCGQLLFEWGVNAMRRGELDRADAIFAELETILPAHVPGRGHRAEVALARGELRQAAALITPLLDVADDP